VGVWTVVGGSGTFVNATIPYTTVNGLNENLNTLNWTVYKNGCSAVNVMRVNNNQFYTSAGPDQSVDAANATMQALEPETGQTGQWQVYSGTGDFGGDIANAEATVTNLGYGPNKFRWTVFDSNTACSAFADVIITYLGFTLDAGEEQYICSDSTQMDAQDPAAGTIAYWSIVSGNCEFVGDISNPSIDVVNIEPGIITLRWNAERNGFSTYDVVVINNYSFDTDAGELQELCQNNTQLQAAGVLHNTDLPAGANWIGTWDIVDGFGEITDESAQNTNITNLYPGQPGVTTLRWRVERTDYPVGGSCMDEDEVTLLYYQMPEPNFTINPQDAGCHPFEANLINTPSADTIAGTLYNWYFDGNIGELTDIPYDPTPVIRPFVNPTVAFNPDNPVKPHDSIYNVRLISYYRINTSLVCKDTVTHPVTVWVVPYVGFDISGHGQEFTNPTNIAVENTSSPNFGDQAYSWNYGNGVAPPPEGFEEFFSVPYYTWGTYTMTLVITNEQCSDDSSQTFTIYPPVPASSAVAGYDAECAPHSHQLWANTEFTTAGRTQYRWVLYKQGDPTAIAQLVEPNPIYSFTEAGVYLARLSVTGEGSIPPWDYTYIRTDTILIHEIPEAQFTIGPIFIDGQDTIIEVIAPDQIHCYNESQNAESYYWDFGDGGTSTEVNPMHAYETDGEYFVTLTVATENECEDTYISGYPVKVLPKCNLKFPNAFTPNLSGPTGGVVDDFDSFLDNDVFIPVVACKEVEEFEMQIYNRWGKLIFVSTDVKIGWDGYIDGKLAPQDVYVYKVKGRYVNGQPFKDINNVTLLR